MNTTRRLATIVSIRTAELELAERLMTLALRASSVGDQRVAARLSVLNAFCRAHADRMKSRLAGLGHAAILSPVPHAGTPCAEMQRAMVQEASLAIVLARRYETLAEVSGAVSDFSTVWVCNMNAQECHHIATELKGLSC